MSEGSWPDLAGRIIRDRDGQRHVLPVRVYFEDTDAGGVVYHASYVRFAERGRTEMLRTIGVEQEKLRNETGMQFVMHEGEIYYRKPARLDDALTVETALVHLGAASVRMRQVIRRTGETPVDGELVRFTANVACTGSDGKPMRMPEKLRYALKSYLSEVR